jgi:hypothetical protein
MLNFVDRIIFYQESHARTYLPPAPSPSMLPEVVQAAQATPWKAPFRISQLANKELCFRMFSNVHYFTPSFAFHLSRKAFSLGRFP